MVALANHNVGLTQEAIAKSYHESQTLVRRTPILTSASLSERCGGLVTLKAENLQRTGSFKIRGALSKLRTLAKPLRGVVAGSAGNHGQALAYAARANGLHCEIYMPVDAAVSKVAAVRAFGAEVHQAEASVDACVDLAKARAAEDADIVFVSPFDDIDVIRGQAGLGLELSDQVEDLACVVVPVGGGGLASGVAVAIKQARPDVVVIGVQAAGCAAFPESLRRGEPVPVMTASTIADGIAIKRPGAITLPLIRTWLDDLVLVDDDAIAEAMVFLLERSKLVVEGAGAVSLAALLTGAARPASMGTTVAVLSGGNVDIENLARITARNETRAGRRFRIFTKIADHPGGLAAFTQAVASARGNVITVEHVRDGVTLALNQTAIEVALQARDHDHAMAVISHLVRSGYDVREMR